MLGSMFLDYISHSEASLKWITTSLCGLSTRSIVAVRNETRNGISFVHQPAVIQQPSNSNQSQELLVNLEDLRKEEGYATMSKVFERAGIGKIPFETIDQLCEAEKLLDENDAAYKIQVSVPCFTIFILHH